MICSGAFLTFDLCCIAFICLVTEPLVSNESAPESNQEGIIKGWQVCCKCKNKELIRIEAISLSEEVVHNTSFNDALTLEQYATSKPCLHQDHSESAHEITLLSRLIKGHIFTCYLQNVPTCVHWWMHYSQQPIQACNCMHIQAVLSGADMFTNEKTVYSLNLRLFTFCSCVGAQVHWTTSVVTGWL